MEIVLGDFNVWRLKRFICFLVCIAVALGLGFWTGYMGVFLLIGLLLYGYIIEQPFMRKTYSAFVENTNQSITVTIAHRKIQLKKSEIQRVYRKEVHYGGKWLETIGERVIVQTRQKKYHFDSGFIKNKDSSYKDIHKLYDLIVESIR